MKKIFRYTLFTAICVLSPVNPSYGVFDVTGEAAIRDTSPLQIARNVADNILNANNNLDKAVSLVLLKDHSLSSHKGDKSYFMTDDKAAMMRMVRYVVENADSYRFYKVNGRDRMDLSKRFTRDEARKLFGTDHMGYDGKFHEYRDNVVLCFDVTGIDRLEDSLNRGILATAFINR